MGKGLIADNN